MPRARDPNRDKAFGIWKQYKGSITNRALAEMLGVPEKTISAWKSRDKWNAVLQTSDCSTTNQKSNKLKSNKVKKKKVEEVFVESDELTVKQRLFCMYYIKYFNATKAYQKAYECAYSTAMVEGHRHLRNPKIVSEIDRMKVERALEIKLDPMDILQKYIDIAFADITDFVKFGSTEEIEYDDEGFPKLDSNGNPKTYSYSYVRLEDSREIDGTIISEVKQGKDGISVKLADKMKALDKLSLYFDLFPDQFKRKIEEEKLAIAKLKYNEEEETYEDDGFLDALNGATKDIWSDEDV